MSRLAVTIVASLVGAALLVWQIQKVGLAEIQDGLAAVGAGFAVILALSLMRFAARSVAWRALMDGAASLPSVLAATIAGDAVGNLTPLRLIASEPTKAVYLSDRVPASRSLTALAAENFFYSLSVVLIIVLGVAAMLWAFAVPAPIRVAGWWLLGVMALMLAGALWIIWRQPAVASALAARIPIRRLARLVPRLQEFEAATYDLLRGRPDRLATVVLCESVFHLLSIAEAFVTLRLLTDTGTPLAAFVLDTVNRLINVTFMAVPLRMGVDETGSGLAAEAIGLTSATGVTMALVRKGRVLVWAAVGLGLLARKSGQRAKGKGQREPQGKRETDL
jgi:hypothetical protein